MKTLFNQIINEKYLPCGVHEEFTYVVWRDKKLLQEVLRRIEKHITKCDKLTRELKLSKDIVIELLKGYEDFEV